MNHVGRGQEIESTKKVINDVSYMSLIQLALTSSLYNFSQVSLNMVHNNEKSVHVFNCCPLDHYDIEQLWEEAHGLGAHLSERFHDFDLPDDFYHFVLVLPEVGNHFYCDVLAGDIASGFHDTAIGSLALLLKKGVEAYDFFPNWVQSNFLNEALLLAQINSLKESFVEINFLNSGV